jgi:hypothetical protein
LHTGLQELFRITKTPLPLQELSHAIFVAVTSSSPGGGGGVMSLQMFENANVHWQLPG